MIVTEALGKNYQGIIALEGLDLHIRPGEIFGLLGPNGAGKTTTIKILTTLARPTRGRAWINDFDVVRQPLQVKRLIGVCPQEINLDKELSAYENLRIYGQLYRVPDLRTRIRELLELGDQSQRAASLVREFSGGMQRRLLILRALMSRPRVLFLDEPTVGLDPQVRRQLWDLIRHLQAQGITILITTHYIEEAEMLCDRVGILSRGHLIALDTPNALTARVGGYVVESLNGVRRQYILVRDKAAAYAQAQNEPSGVIIRQANLEDVFIKLTGERLQH
ncbi:MAG: ABC transporter [Desulfobacca sp. 4484_104]|nr:MAG: ABC transporter [Desulfobacca sp. 4484_104]RLA88201.1 MAG: ABC transporter ATP-binding protein [Deltaproteobacteria bacterium]